MIFLVLIRGGGVGLSNRKFICSQWNSSELRVKFIKCNYLQDYKASSDAECSGLVRPAVLKSEIKNCAQLLVDRFRSEIWLLLKVCCYVGQQGKKIQSKLLKSYEFLLSICSHIPWTPADCGEEECGLRSWNSRRLQIPVCGASSLEQQSQSPWSKAHFLFCLTDVVTCPWWVTPSRLW